LLGCVPEVDGHGVGERALARGVPLLVVEPPVRFGTLSLGWVLRAFDGRARGGSLGERDAGAEQGEGDEQAREGDGDEARGGVGWVVGGRSGPDEPTLYRAEEWADVGAIPVAGGALCVYLSAPMRRARVLPGRRRTQI
jgi:hypothetical protein